MFKLGKDIYQMQEKKKYFLVGVSGEFTQTEEMKCCCIACGCLRGAQHETTQEQEGEPGFYFSHKRVYEIIYSTYTYIYTVTYLY